MAGDAMGRTRSFLRRARPWIWSAVFIGGCAIVVGTSRTFEQCADNPEYKEAAPNLQDGIAHFVGMYRHCIGEFVHANGEGIIAAFTVILAISTIALWAATKTLVRGAEQTAERQLRVYVLPEKAVLNNLVSGGSPQAQIVIKTSGRHPPMTS